MTEPYTFTTDNLNKEDWKYLNLKPLASLSFIPTKKDMGVLKELPVSDYILDDLQAQRVIFVNGFYMSSDANFAASALKVECENAKVSIHIKKDINLSRPIHLIYLSKANGAATFSSHSLQIHAESNSQATIIESFAGITHAPYLTNAATTIRLDKGATINHYKIQDEATQSFHLASLKVSQDRDSHFSSCSLSLGAEISRYEIQTELRAENAECHFAGLYVVNGNQQVDHHTRVDHLKPHGISRTFYKGIIDNRAKGIFNGRVVVHPLAQKSDSNMINKNLLLSDEAEADPKPELEIYADDVKCSHGATVGQLDENALFYLQTRGIKEHNAKMILTHAFAAELMEEIKFEALRKYIEKLINQKL